MKKISEMTNAEQFDLFNQEKEEKKLKKFSKLNDVKPLNLYDLEKNNREYGETNDVVYLRHRIFDKLEPSNTTQTKGKKYYINKYELKPYKDIVEALLYSIYSEYVETEYINGKERKGIVYKGDDSPWSKFNKMNTNMKIIVYTFNFLNKYILPEKKYTYDSEIVDTVVDLLKEYGKILYTNEVFMTGVLIIIDNLIDMDSNATQFIEDYFKTKGFYGFKLPKAGDMDDMNLGIDMTFHRNEKQYTAQIKNYTEQVEEDDDNYIINSFGRTKTYSSDNVYYMVFYKYNSNNVEYKKNKNVVNILTFKNDSRIKTKVGGGKKESKYIIPKDLFRDVMDSTEEKIFNKE